MSVWLSAEQLRALEWMTNTPRGYRCPRCLELWFCDCTSCEDCEREYQDCECEQ